MQETLPQLSFTVAVSLSQEVDVPPPPLLSNARFVLFGQKLQEESSRIIRGGGWALSRPHISHSPKSGDLPSHTGTERLLAGKSGEHCLEMLYPDTSALRSILAKRCVCTHGRMLRYAK